jgi:AcrR family transcriptional regulator
MTIDRTTPAPADPGSSSLSGAANLGDTEAKILDAAFRRLAQVGYAALSVRDIAKDAGVNHALIHYHFGSKDQLVIAVLDEANRRLLARQQRMYRGPGRFADKWAEARRFYEDDLGSGFVRVQAELWAASFSNLGLREKFLPRILAWKDVVLGGVRDALATAEKCGVELPAPFSADVIAALISEFWLGMEFADLIGATEQQLHHRATLDAIEHLLEQLDALALKHGGVARSDRSKPAKRRRRRKKA